MSPRSARRLVIFAFALSLLLHAFIACSLHLQRGHAPNGVEVVNIEHRALVMHVQKPASPPPHLPRRPARTASPAPRATAASGLRPAGGGASRATAAPTAPPTPAPTAAACANADVAASVVASPAPPEIPLAARADGTSGTAVIAVQLDAQGNVAGARVGQSSGNADLDVVALGMARDARYAPPLHDCKPVAGTYAFSVKFAAW